MAVNRYPDTCYLCNARVSARAGTLTKAGRRWLVSHMTCRANKTASVHSITFSSGATITQNSRGRCEDAPACGCCT